MVGIDLDRIIGIEGTAGYIIIILLIVIGYYWLYPSPSSLSTTEEGGEEEEMKEPPRNFTRSQLQYFDGKKDPKTEEDKPVYLSVDGTVFDVSNGRDFYGPNGPYEKFAGRECGVALAKMSFDETFLDDMEGCKKLEHGDKIELENWIEKFTYYRGYPILGRLITDDLLPSSNRILSKEELEKNNGTGKIPEGYATAPIYVGVGDYVYDCSFGGVSFYGPDGGYNRFAGKDVTRALAKMSFEPEDIDSCDISDLNKTQKETLADWIKTFKLKKGYPVVGKLAK